jgi:hypothetical protein
MMRVGAELKKSETNSKYKEYRRKMIFIIKYRMLLQRYSKSHFKMFQLWRPTHPPIQ